MLIVAGISLLIGIVFGYAILPPELVEWVSMAGDWVLMLLMFLVGISVGGNKEVFAHLKDHRFKILLVPIGVMVGSALAGAVCGWLTGFPVRESVPIACGMGWYSLSGIMLTDLAGARVGAVAFLSNLMREMLAFGLIPFLARHLNHYAAIAAAGATSEDTALPILMKHTSEEIVVMAVFNGVVTSAFVPILIRLFHSL